MSDIMQFDLLFTATDRSGGVLNKFVSQTRSANAAMAQQAMMYDRLGGSTDNYFRKYNEYLTKTAKNAVIAAGLGIAAVALYKTIDKTLNKYIELERQINFTVSASGAAVGSLTDQRKAFDLYSGAIKNATSKYYGLTESAKAYYELLSAGFQSQTRMNSSGKMEFIGPDITAQALKASETLAIISQGELTLAQAAETLPAIVAKTGISLTRQYDNQMTQTERFMDKLAAVVQFTKMKIKDLPALLDSTRTSMQQLNVTAEDMLAITGSFMTAGMSKKEAGQAFNSMVQSVSKTAALMIAQRDIYGPILAQKNFTREVNSTQSLMNKNGMGANLIAAFGSVADFQKMTQALIDKTISPLALLDQLKKTTNWSKVSAQGQSYIQTWLNNFQNDSMKVMGGINARRKMFAIDQLFSSRSDFMGLLEDLSSGKKSISDFYKVIEDGLNNPKMHYSLVEKKGLLQMFFGDSVTAQAFINMSRQFVTVTRDIFAVDESGEKLKQWNSLTKKMEEVKLYSQGQVIAGVEVSKYFASAARDSKGLAEGYKRIFEESGAGLVQMKKALGDTFTVLLGEGVLPMFKSFLQLTNTALSGVNKIMADNPQIAKTAGVLMAVSAAIMAIVAGKFAVTSAWNMYRTAMFQAKNQANETTLAVRELTVAMKEQNAVGVSGATSKTIQDKKMILSSMENVYSLNGRNPNRIKAIKLARAEIAALEAQALGATNDMVVSSKGFVGQFKAFGTKVNTFLNSGIAKMLAVGGVIFLLQNAWEKNAGVVGQFRGFLQGNATTIGLLSKYSGTSDLKAGKGNFTNNASVESLLTKSEREQLKNYTETIAQPAMKNLYSNVLSKLGGVYGESGVSMAEEYMSKGVSGPAKDKFEKLTSAYSQVLLHGNIKDKNSLLSGFIGAGFYETDKNGNKVASSMAKNLVEELMIKGDKTGIGKYQKSMAEYDKLVKPLVDEAKARTFYKEGGGWGSLFKYLDSFVSFFNKMGLNISDIALGVGIGFVAGGPVGAILGALAAIVLSITGQALSSKDPKASAKALQRAAILLGGSLAIGGAGCSYRRACGRTYGRITRWSSCVVWNKNNIQ